MPDNYDLSQAGGVKFDGDKPRMDLIPFDALLATAEVFTYGATKYSAHNWAHGMRWGRLVASLLRHVAAFMLGEDRDSETGCSHIAHANCCCMMLLSHVLRNIGTDDRFKETPCDNSTPA